VREKIGASDLFIYRMFKSNTQVWKNTTLSLAIPRGDVMVLKKREKKKSKKSKKPKKSVKRPIKCPLCKQTRSQRSMVRGYCDCCAIKKIERKVILLNGEEHSADVEVYKQHEECKRIFEEKEVLAKSEKALIECRRAEKQKTKKALERASDERNENYAALTITHKKSRIPKKDRRAFLASNEWKRLRYLTFKEQGKQCNCCGESGKRAIYHVDHIKPMSLYWNLRANPKNLQILCEHCNLGKSNIDTTDWR